MAPPTVLLSISKPQATLSQTKPQNENVNRYGESERPHISPYDDPRTDFELRPVRSRCQSPSTQPEEQFLHPVETLAPALSTQRESPQLKEEFPASEAAHVSLSQVTELSPKQQRPPTRCYLTRNPIPSSSTYANMEPLSKNPGAMSPKHGLLPSAKAPPAKKLKGETFYDNPDRILQDERSPIFKEGTPTKRIFEHHLAKATLAATTSGNRLEGVSCDNFNTDVAAFKENGRAGRYDEEYIGEAQLAVRTRAAGGFDEYLADKFENDWHEDNPEISDEDEEDKYMDKGSHDVVEKKFHRRDDDDGSGPSGGKPFGFGTKSTSTHNGFNGYGNDKGKNGGTSTQYDYGKGNGYDTNHQHGVMEHFDVPVRESKPSINGHGNSKTSDHATDYKPTATKFITPSGIDHDEKLPGFTYLAFNHGLSLATGFRLPFNGEVYVACAVHESKAFLKNRYDPKRVPSAPCWPMKDCGWWIGQSRIEYLNSLLDDDEATSTPFPEML